MPLVVPDPPASVAAATAESRRRALQEHLATQVESARALRAFRESPVQVSQEQTPFLEGPAAAAELARLRWQLGSSGLLLLERVADVLETLVGSRDGDLVPGSMCVSLETLPRYRTLRGMPPWRVVVSAPGGLRLENTLADYGRFFGIGVFVRREATFKSFSRCTVGDGGMDGVVGGVLRSRKSPDDVFLATCRHVIAEGCGSLQHPAYATRPDAPDAVLLRQTGCFHHPDEHAMPVFPADEAAIARFQVARTPLTLHHPERRRRLGWLKYPVAAIVGPTGHFIRFPHYSVQPFRYRVGFLRWPPLRPHFARPGDSGSWVIETSSRIWLGMVVAGFDDHSDTLVADGRALLDYYSSIAGHASRTGASGLDPYTW
jgi:hypothetical protein